MQKKLEKNVNRSKANQMKDTDGKFLMSLMFLWVLDLERIE